MKKLLFALLVAACGKSTVTVGTMQEIMIEPEVPNTELDVLFVVDNSPSMMPKQDALRASFPKMMEQLAALPGGLPDLHIAVVTTDLGTSDRNGNIAPAIPGSVGGCSEQGDNGLFRTAPDVVADNYIVAGATQNYTGSLEDAFSALTEVGAIGCGFEQPIGAAVRALTSTDPHNAGFLRPEANLLVAFIGDEDDCSLENAAMLTTDTSRLGPLQSFRCTRYGVTCDDGGATPDDMNQDGSKSECHASTDTTYLVSVDGMADQLKALKVDASQIMVAAIAPPSDPVTIDLEAPAGSSTPIPAVENVCDPANVPDGWLGAPGVRYAEFAAQFPTRSSVESLCASSDLTLPLTNIGITARQMMGDTCIDVPLLDTSDVPGVQPQCDVEENGAKLPMCDATTRTDCWVVATSPSCQLADHLALTLIHAAPIAGVYAHVSCLTD
ncbi:MAG: hypothetical protein QM831_06785 [Kofleriaceae bacterium]